GEWSRAAAGRRRLAGRDRRHGPLEAVVVEQAVGVGEKDDLAAGVLQAPSERGLLSLAGPLLEHHDARTLVAAREPVRVVGSPGAEHVLEVRVAERQHA